MGYRLERINRLIKEEVARRIREELPPEEFGWISVSGVKTSPDLSQAHVFVTVFPEYLEKRVLDRLNRMAGKFRKHLAKNLKVKTVPRLLFQADTLTKLLEKGIVKPPEGEL